MKSLKFKDQSAKLKLKTENVLSFAFMFCALRFTLCACFIFLWLAAALSFVAVAQAEIIPAERRIGWKPGIPGGIPFYSNEINVKDKGAKGDGVTDDTAAIKAAIAACHEGYAVFFPAGDYLTTDTITIGKSIVLRGEEDPVNGRPMATIKNTHANYSGGIVTFSRLGLDYDYTAKKYNDVAVTEGYYKDSIHITVQDASRFQGAEYILIDQLNDGYFVRIEDKDGPATWMSRNSGTRALGQILHVESIVGNTINLDRETPLYSDYSQSREPMALKFLGMIKLAGLESIHIEGLYSDAKNNIIMNYAANCWLKNVESSFSAHAQVYLMYAFRCEIRDSYFYGSRTGYMANNGYGIELARQSTANLMENNIYYLLHVPQENAGGACGNVWAYNYNIEHFFREPSWLAGGIGFHGGHPYMNLVEGNVLYVAGSDAYWGSAAYQTFFRNRSFGSHLPYTSSKNNAIDIQATCLFYNIIGNVLGIEGVQTMYEISADYSGWKWNEAAVYKLGFNDFGDMDAANNDPKVISTMIRHGNFDYLEGTKWDDSIPERNLPPSLYLTSRPSYSWWPDDIPWPPIGPDVPNLVNTLPAERRFTQITAGNELPEVSDLEFNARKDIVFSGSLAEGSRSPDGRDLIFFLLDNTYGKGDLVLTNNRDGSFTFTPKVGFLGDIGVYYYAFDGIQASKLGHLTIHVKEQAFITGDVNGDDVVDINDAVMAVDLALDDFAGTADERARADIDGNGSVNVTDVVQIVEIILSAQ